MAVLFRVPHAFESGSTTVDLVRWFLLLLGLLLVSVTATCIYHAYFHPLSKFPGPKLWATSSLFRHVATVQGQLDWYIMEMHKKYGPVVRFSPVELSFISDQAWKDIYGSHNPPIVKDPTLYNPANQTHSIFNADEKTHPRMRKSLAHAFSAKALREQEPLIRKYVDILIAELESPSYSGAAVAMEDWYNFTTFDTVGDLTIGKSFHTLYGSSNREWIKQIFSTIRIGAYFRTVGTYINPVRILRIVEACVPKQVLEDRNRYNEHMNRCVEERTSRGVLEERRDFMSYILKHQDKANGLTTDEIKFNCGFLIVAGSETTATALAGITWYLLTNPDKLAKLTAEIRGAFETEEEMTFANLGTRLPYTMAVINEGLRLYPSAPTIAPRRTPPGCKTYIDGYEVPGWTNVGVHALAASRSPMNFHQPLDFIPERWLPEATENPKSPFYNDHRAASQPFSYGSRACLGKSLAYDEMKLILAKLFWRYDLELCEESQEWGTHQLSFGLWAKPELMCRLKDARKTKEGVMA